MINDIEKVKNNNETTLLRGILRNHDNDDDYMIENRLLYICVILFCIFIITPIVIVCSIRFWV